MIYARAFDGIIADPLLGFFTLVGLGAFMTYLLPVFLQIFVLDFFPVNLKKKYKAEWALVTGASSGM